jgi:hypothetical protein
MTTLICRSKVGSFGDALKIFNEGWIQPQNPANLRMNNLGMSFGDAIEVLKRGLHVTREGWNGKGMYLALQVPDEHSKMTWPYIYMKTAQGALVPWVASQTDILADDWRLA